MGHYLKWMQWVTLIFTAFPFLKREKMGCLVLINGGLFVPPCHTVTSLMKWLAHPAMNLWTPVWIPVKAVSDQPYLPLPYHSDRARTHPHAHSTSLSINTRSSILFSTFGEEEEDKGQATSIHQSAVPNASTAGSQHAQPHWLNIHLLWHPLLCGLLSSRHYNFLKAECLCLAFQTFNMFLHIFFFFLYPIFMKWLVMHAKIVYVCFQYTLSLRLFNMFLLLYFLFSIHIKSAPFLTFYLLEKAKLSCRWVFFHLNSFFKSSYHYHLFFTLFLIINTHTNFLKMGIYFVFYASFFLNILNTLLFIMLHISPLLKPFLLIM